MRVTYKEPGHICAMPICIRERGISRSVWCLWHEQGTLLQTKHEEVADGNLAGTNDGDNYGAGTIGGLDIEEVNSDIGSDKEIDRHILVLNPFV